MNEKRETAITHLIETLQGFVWLGNNLHNIREDPDRFQWFYKQLLEEAKEALEKEKGTRVQ